MSCELFNPIKGSRLLELYTEYASSNYPNLVFGDPNIAIQRISDFFGQSPAEDGTNIEGIQEIRRYFETVESPSLLSNAFTVLAPHTHWDANKPVIYKYDDQSLRYIVGPHYVVPERTYNPVSFVFGVEYPIVYEWVDESIAIKPTEYAEVQKMLIMLNVKFFEKKYPLGLGLDFRFKSQLWEPPSSTVEIAEEDNTSAYYDFAYIMQKADFFSSRKKTLISKVAWPISNTEHIPLSLEEDMLLQELRLLLLQAKTEHERSEILLFIERQLGT